MYSPASQISLDESYRPQFTGHETFPLRYGWLKKVFDAVNDNKGKKNNKSLFRDDDATARFGVGKNMVSSMRHWGKSTEIIEETQKSDEIRTTKIGQLYFGENGLDPYMEHPTTLWHLHWRLASMPQKTTWFWSFNIFAGTTFERETLVDGLFKLSNKFEWNRVSRNTIKRDVECFIRTYVTRMYMDESTYDDVVESPFTELGLIRNTGRRDGFQFMRGSKNTLTNGMLTAAVVEFWQNFQNANTLSFNELLHSPGSPGRVFLLDEESLAEKLAVIEDVTDGRVRWSESAGLRQILRDTEFTKDFSHELIRSDFEKRANLH